MLAIRSHLNHGCCRGLIRRNRDHGLAEKVIGSGPGSLHIRRKIDTEPLLKGPQQSGTDAGVVLFPHPVFVVTSCKSAEIIQDRVNAVERLYHRGDCRHQLGTLTRHVAAKEWARARIDDEETVIEERCRLLPHGDDLGKALSHKGDLPGVIRRLAACMADPANDDCYSAEVGAAEPLIQS